MRETAPDRSAGQADALRAYVKAVVDKAPPLTPHQRDVIAVTFQGANVPTRLEPAGDDVLSEMMED